MDDVVFDKDARVASGALCGFSEGALDVLPKRLNAFFSNFLKSSLSALEATSLVNTWPISMCCRMSLVASGADSC
eukprot:CAMPEP_0181490478 /NCGR_PEP_ID=MMETSP1110-20121109/49576_1 /TAXON_ID=174948 /ORGANISM="Symbiodinium sp., Strain CCMP421" /LENGTH=74 /DNA_ID=CAMNT_0023617459 /DNA_START=352 /DNA_END=573 /DNA_ORIENTATION=+